MNGSILQIVIIFTVYNWSLTKAGVITARENDNDKKIEINLNINLNGLNLNKDAIGAKKQAITKPRWISQEQGSVIKAAIKQKLENEQKNGKLRQLNHEAKQRGVVGDFVGKKVGELTDLGVDKFMDLFG